MTDEDEVFLNYLKGVKPLNKKNKTMRPPLKYKTAEKNKNIKKTTDLKTKQKKTDHKEVKRKTHDLKVETNLTNKKLKKGQIPINKRVDLHGYTVDEAKTTFIETINECFFNKQRCILFITGKGIKKNKEENFTENKLYYGKIRNSFLDWIRIAEIQTKILNVEQAPIKFGGDGAFLVYLRKNKD